MPNTVRLFHFICDENGLKNIKERHLKLSFSNLVNDLFELRPFDFGEGKEGRQLRRAWGGAIDKHSTTQGFISFSKSWSVPTMWGYYADNHRGICLGFDVPADLAQKIKYKKKLRPMDSRVLEDEQYKNEMVAYAAKTKSRHWKYEDEWRVWSDLNKQERKQRDTKPDGLIFEKFGVKLVLREVIFGKRSELSTESVQSHLFQSDEVDFTTARPSFRHFGMVRQENEDYQK